MQHFGTVSSIKAARDNARLEKERCMRDEHRFLAKGDFDRARAANKEWRAYDDEYRKLGQLLFDRGEPKPAWRGPCAGGG